MKRRAAVEPSIGLLRGENSLELDLLRGTLGDSIHALLGGAAMHFEKLLGMLRNTLLALLDPLRSEDP